MYDYWCDPHTIYLTQVIDTRPFPRARWTLVDFKSKSLTRPFLAANQSYLCMCNSYFISRVHASLLAIVCPVNFEIASQKSLC